MPLFVEKVMSGLSVTLHQVKMNPRKVLVSTCKFYPMQIAWALCGNKGTQSVLLRQLDSDTTHANGNATTFQGVCQSGTRWLRH